MFARVLREGAILILRPREEATDGLVAFGDTGRRSRSLMFVPIRYGERPTGIMSIQSYTPDAYDEESSPRCRSSPTTAAARSSGSGSSTS